MDSCTPASTLHLAHRGAHLTHLSHLASLRVAASHRPATASHSSVTGLSHDRHRIVTGNSQGSHRAATGPLRATASRRTGPRQSHCSRRTVAASHRTVTGPQPSTVSPRGAHHDAAPHETEDSAIPDLVDVSCKRRHDVPTLVLMRHGECPCTQLLPFCRSACSRRETCACSSAMEASLCCHAFAGLVVPTLVLMRHGQCLCTGLLLLCSGAPAIGPPPCIELTVVPCRVCRAHPFTVQRSC